MRQRGFTLIELLIIISIIIILLILIIMNLQGQIARANDAKRKSDLYTIHNGLEEYNNDHLAFPPEGSISQCAGAGMQPYVKQIPCDPVTRQPYGYFVSGAGGYRVCTILQDTSDPSIKAIGCGGPQKCGVGGGFNWCLSSGVPPSAVGAPDQGFFGNPTPTLGPGHWACAPPDFTGTSYCKSYADPAGFGCPVTFADSHCLNSCGNAANRCTE